MIKIKIVAILFMSLCISSCSLLGEEDESCDDDKNGLIKDKCAKVISKFDGYKSDGETYETIKLTFILGTGAYDLIVTDTDGLFEKSIYRTDATLRFSGFESQKTLIVYISKVDRSGNGRKISGSFEFTGTTASNFQSFPAMFSGEFNDVQF